VSEIDGKPIGTDGGNGPVLTRIRALYKALIAENTA
jgi:branched-chain amino acid aminotransferase